MKDKQCSNLLINKEAVRRYVRENGEFYLESKKYRTIAGEAFMKGLDNVVASAIDKAINKRKSKKRMTLKPEDLF